MTQQISGILDAILAAGSQRKLAEELGVTQQAVQQWKQQGFAPRNRVAEIETLYGVERARLLDPRLLVSTPNFTQV